MDPARAAAQDGAPEGTAIQSGEQTAGRGRFGNAWTSPVGNLYMTTILRPQKPARDCAQVSFVVALALFDALIAAGVDAATITLKWPNDVLVGGRKVAGILLEQEMAKGTDVPAFMLVGTGINIAHAPDGAVAINDVLASPVGVDEFRDAFLSALSGRYEIWGKDGFAPLRDDWLSHAHGVGGPVTARMAEKSLSGTFEGVDENGTLVMRDDHGEIRHISGAAIHFGGANS